MGTLRESSDLEAMLRRMTRALVRRAEAGDTDALVALMRVGKSMRAAENEAAGALIGKGYTWEDLAGESGLTKQGAEQRWNK